MMSEISSPSNPLIKRVRKLRRARGPDGPCVVEGIAPVAAAMASGAEVELVLFAPELLTGEGGLRLLEEVRAAGVPASAVSPEAFASLSSRDSPAGVAALVVPDPVSLDAIEHSDEALVVALHQPGNPGNLGTIIRTAAAAGCDGVVIAGASTDPFGAEAVKASMGSVFSVPIAFCDALDQVFGWARPNGVKVIATSAHSSESLWDSDAVPPCVLMFGSERLGLPEEAMDQADLCVGLPMSGSVGSLNLAVAAGIVIFDVIRRARATP